MSANVSIIEVKRNFKIKSIALPTEHGSWGFLFEPLIAAMAIAPSFAAVWIALLIIGAFLTRQPLKVLLSDWAAKRNLPQTLVALRFVLIFGARLCANPFCRGYYPDAWAGRRKINLIGHLPIKLRHGSALETVARFRFTQSKKTPAIFC